jgi:cysteinyl-tRNA synthetase
MKPCFLLVPVLLAVTGISGVVDSNAEPKAPLLLDQVRFGAYQIQDLHEAGMVDGLAASRYDMLVVEPTRTDKNSEKTRKFDTAAMVRKLKASMAHDGKHHKLVLAYISIGEAEEWRWYWTWPTWAKNKMRPPNLPPWIVAPDPEGWTGCFPVAFWDKEWKKIVLGGAMPAHDQDYNSIVDEVVRDGFDGVYLDWVEAFEEDNVKKAADKLKIDPAKEMVALIGEIKKLGRKTNPNFIVIQQNGSALIDVPGILNVVDAIAQEDLWYRGDADADWDQPNGYDRAQGKDFTDEVTANLDKYKRAGKPVFTIDYTVKHADEVYAKAKAKGYVAYCSRTSLSRLSGTPPPGYSEDRGRPDR